MLPIVDIPPATAPTQSVIELRIGFAEDSRSPLAVRETSIETQSSAVPTLERSLVLADAATQAELQNIARVIGVCQLTSSHPDSAGSGLSPVAEVRKYLKIVERHGIESRGAATVITKPEHGRLTGPTTRGTFGYHANDGYIGNDRASLLIELDSNRYQVEYFFRVMESVPEAYPGEPSIHEQGYCPVKARVWKISSLNGLAMKYS